ncbi:glycoside hydrolase family 15 protein [Microbacterium maritypicum]|uniref:Glycoside hydrolase family 15 protein n=1 Tax=Microbacterium maritypicum TaxID=33918 RepID=A0ACD4B640_MICMQ|nr:glycoside hydrolase family 15 protein [Microbacterium liquefaciens]UTT53140.1 glycoside hydrolase family 15 protein [Microbacterium liquefaciens]
MDRIGTPDLEVRARIEDYALLSNCRTAALVSRAGSIDWLCLPRLDSASTFAAVLGDESHGRWLLRPTDPAAVSTRRYDDDTFVLVTRWESAGAVAEVHDFMPIGLDPDTAIRRTDLIRRVVGVQGSIRFEQRLSIRFDYARVMPWVRQVGSPGEPCLVAMGGPDAVALRGAPLKPIDHQHRGELTVAAGEVRDLQLTWFPSHLEVPPALEVEKELGDTKAWWQDWADRISHDGPHRDEVVRSLLILRALTNHETGGIAAAATMALPEEIGGVRNWDYRYVWLRDAALTLEALLAHGFLGVAGQWREWLLRAVAGDPADLQIMYGPAGERDLPERALPNLPGYEGSTPVRIGNGAAGQYQADVVGEVLVTLSAARAAGLNESGFSWPLERELLRFASEQIDRPDQGLWEIRGEPRLFTHSRVMMWAAFDRAVLAVEEYGLEGPVERWRGLRDRMREEIDRDGVVDGHFVQHYATTEVDASLLLLPQVGYCPPDDPRMLATVERIEQTLMSGGLVRRYRTATGVDGLSGTEGAFLACSFWLVEQYALTGRRGEAAALMDRLCELANDVGMLSEEYDPVAQRQLGNTPQAFSHLALVRAADALAMTESRMR